MKQSSRLLRRGLALAACALLLPLAPAGALPKWDDKKVEYHVHNVVVAVSRIKERLARDWDRADRMSVRYVVINDLMILHHRAIALEGLVRAGQGRDKTLPVFRRMRSAVRHAREDVTLFPELEAQRKYIDKAEAGMQELNKFYGLAPFPPMEISGS